MHDEALNKIMQIARKNPKVLLSPSFFAKICTRLDIETNQTPDVMTFSRGERKAEAVIITPQNCADFKCIVGEGKNGIRIYEFINVLVKLLTDEKLPPSPHVTMGKTAVYYCELGTDILEQKLLSKPI